MWLQRLVRRRAGEPHLCRVCGCDFVYPVDWHEASETHFFVRLRCGACGSWREEMFTDDLIDAGDFAR